MEFNILLNSKIFEWVTWPFYFWILCANFSLREGGGGLVLTLNS